MGKIDYGRVLIGGVAAGVVLLLLDMAGMAVLGFDHEAWSAQHQLTIPPMWMWIVMDLAFGIMIVWLYAAIRPRFGPGTKTALIAAAFMWVFFGLMFWAQTAMGLYTQAEYMKFALWGVVQMAAASWVGAWLYRENV